MPDISPTRPFLLAFSIEPRRRPGPPAAGATSGDLVPMRCRRAGPNSPPLGAARPGERRRHHDRPRCPAHLGLTSSPPLGPVSTTGAAVAAVDQWLEGRAHAPHRSNFCRRSARSATPLPRSPRSTSARRRLVQGPRPHRLACRRCPRDAAAGLSYAGRGRG